MVHASRVLSSRAVNLPDIKVCQFISHTFVGPAQLIGAGSMMNPPGFVNPAVRTKCNKVFENFTGKRPNNLGDLAVNSLITSGEPDPSGGFLIRVSVIYVAART